MGRMNVPMAGWCDEVKEDVYTIIPESRVTLNTRFFGKNAIVLSLEVSNDF